MGIFDEYENVQMKVGNPGCRNFKIGDIVPIPDGVYFGNEGAVVVADRKLVLVLEQVRDKWGGAYDSWEWDYTWTSPRLILIEQQVKPIDAVEQPQEGDGESPHVVEKEPPVICTGHDLGPTMIDWYKPDMCEECGQGAFLCRDPRCPYNMCEACNRKRMDALMRDYESRSRLQKFVASIFRL